MAAHQAPRPWDSPGKNTGVGCHFLLQCMKVKSESEVAQSCPTPSNPVDCSPPGSSVHGIFQARVLEWGAIDFSALPRGHQGNPPPLPSSQNALLHPEIRYFPSCLELHVHMRFTYQDSSGCLLWNDLKQFTVLTIGSSKQSILVPLIWNAMLMTCWTQRPVSGVYVLFHQT